MGPRLPDAVLNNLNNETKINNDYSYQSNVGNSLTVHQGLNQSEDTSETNKERRENASILYHLSRNDYERRMGIEKGLSTQVISPLVQLETTNQVESKESEYAVGTRLLSWNVAGIKSKLSCPEWGDFIDKQEICMFQETWAREDLQRVGFATFNKHAIIGGRPSGGLAIWVATHLGCSIKEITTSTADIQCVLLSFPTKTKLVLINVYSRPVNNSQESDTITKLGLFIQSLDPGLGLIVGGDFNCHFEPLIDPLHTVPLEEDLYWSIPDPQTTPVKTWSPLALQLNSLTLAHSLRACNGRFESDRPGQPTFNRVGQTSLIDYILVQARLWANILDFFVELRQDSDHNALVLILKPGVLGIDRPNCNLTIGPCHLRVTNNRKNVRWAYLHQAP